MFTLSYTTQKNPYPNTAAQMKAAKQDLSQSSATHDLTYLNIAGHLPRVFESNGLQLENSINLG